MLKYTLFILTLPLKYLKIHIKPSSLKLFLKNHKVHISCLNTSFEGSESTTSAFHELVSYAVVERKDSTTILHCIPWLPVASTVLMQFDQIEGTLLTLKISIFEFELHFELKW